MLVIASIPKMKHPILFFFNGASLPLATRRTPAMCFVLVRSCDPANRPPDPIPERKNPRGAPESHLARARLPRKRYLFILPLVS